MIAAVGATPKKELAEIVDAVARRIEDELSTGEVAELRRWNEHKRLGPTFWRLRAEFLTDEPIENETKWALIFAGLARLTGPSHPDRKPPHLSPRLHSRGRHLGEALAVADYHPDRFEALLAAHDGALLDAVDRLAQFLAQKGEESDWSIAALLVFSDRGSREEEIRRNLARIYYATLSKQ